MELTDEQVIARWLLDYISPTEVVQWASELVASGQTGPALTELAALYADDSPRVGELLASLWVDQGRSPMTHREALARLVLDVAQRIIARQLSPYDGARTIFGQAVRLGAELDAAYVAFSASVSEWDDDEDHRAEIEADIVEDALAYVSAYPEVTLAEQPGGVGT